MAIHFEPLREDNLHSKDSWSQEYPLFDVSAREIYLPSLSVIITGVALFCMLRLDPGVVRASMTVNSSSPSTMLSAMADSVVHASALSPDPGPKVRGIKSMEKSPAVAET